MTKSEFQHLTENLTLLDGATGSYLMQAGMPRGVCTETWVLEHKDIFQELQRAYVEAGSQILYAPTFGANRVNLTMHGLAHRIKELNRALVSYSQETAAGRAFVAGDITTTGKMMEPAGDMTYETAFEVYCEQVELLARAGVDMIAAETMISIEETLAAVDAVHTVCDLPVLCSVTVESDGSLFTGGNAVEAAVSFEAAGADAVGVNCSVGPDQLTAVIRSIRDAVSIPVVAKPNAGMPLIDEKGNAVYSMTAKDFAGHMRTLTQSGATLIGGCCGTTPAFIREIHDLLF
ncbi:MAG: homocysteine S-methyltransferase family protein [Clostridiales bacterium]|nr:homocysteine S-methyltransferase family protein [Clostridiales bacterium]